MSVKLNFAGTMAAILFIAGFSACSLIEPKGQDILNLQDDFELQLFERIEPNKKQLEILVRTAEKQSCENTQIALSSEILTTGIVLRLEDIIQPEESECIPGDLFIQNEVPVDDFTGDQDFIVQVSDIVEHNGIISSTPLKASFFLSGTEGIKIRNNELNKIPLNLIWGSISTDTSDALPAYENFISTLENECDIADLIQGYYSYFFIDGNKEASFRFGMDDHPFRYDFALSYNGDVRELFNTLEAVSDPRLFIDITAYNGLRY